MRLKCMETSSYIYRPSEKEQTRENSQKIETIYNEWMQNRNEKTLRINSKEFHEIESQFRINEIGNKILIFHRKTNFTYSQENEQFGKD